MEKKILLVDCDGVVSESFNGKKLKHLLVQGIEDEKVVFEARVGLRRLILKRRNCNLMVWRLICCLKTGIGAVRRHRKIIL